MIDKATGQPIDELTHIQQSISTIMLTYIGSRIQRRDFGSHLFELVDAPVTDRTLQLLIAVTADAVMRWEPRIRMNNTRIDISPDRAVTITTKTSLNRDVSITQPLGQLVSS